MQKTLQSSDTLHSEIMSPVGLLLAVVLFTVVTGVPSGQKGPFPIQSFPGKCPELAVDAAFDLKKLASGVWYQVYSSDEVHANDSTKCIERRYSYTENNTTLGIDKYYILNRRPIWTKSSLIRTDKNGVFLHQTPQEAEAAWYQRVEIQVLSYDPESFILMWGCLYDTKNDKHYESAGISSRQRSLDSKKFDQLKSLLSDNKASVQFETVDWSDCRAKCD